MRLFYQIYADGKFSEIFEVQPFCGWEKEFYAEFFNCLAKRGITEFREDSKQYVIKVSGDVEVKISKFGTLGKKWVQVSATTPEAAKAVFEDLKRYIKTRLEARKGLMPDART